MGILAIITNELEALILGFFCQITLHFWRRTPIHVHQIKGHRGVFINAIKGLLCVAEPFTRGD
jgi:hypothetical protein